LFKEKDALPPHGNRTMKQDAFAFVYVVFNRKRENAPEQNLFKDAFAFSFYHYTPGGKNVNGFFSIGRFFFGKPPEKGFSRNRFPGIAFLFVLILDGAKKRAYNICNGQRRSFPCGHAAREWALFFFRIGVRLAQTGRRRGGFL
jgi:hypothetical protein